MGALRRAHAARVRQHVLGYALIAPPFLVLCLLVAYPALRSIWDTLAVQQVVIRHGRQVIERVFTFEQYTQIFTNPKYHLDREAIFFTLRVTVVSLVALFALCYPLAMYLRFSRGWLPTVFRNLALIPLFIPTIISCFAFISFYQQGNFLDVLLQDTGLEQHVFGGQFPLLIDDMTGIVLAQVWNSIPITTLLIGAGLADIDTTLIESARDVGAGYGRIFRSIIFPLTLRQTLIAFILAFIGIMGSYNVPYLLGPTRPQMIGPMMDNNINIQRVLTAQTEAVLTFVMAALVGALYAAAVVRRRGR